MSSNGNGTQMVRTTMAIPIDIGGGQVAKINLPPGATLAGPVKVLTLPNQQTIAHVTVMAPPGVVEKYVAQAAAESEQNTTPKPAHTQLSPQSPPDVSVFQPPRSPKSEVTPKPPSEPVKNVLSNDTSSGRSNLFDKLTPKSPATPKPAAEKQQVQESQSTPKQRSASSSDDNVPLSSFSKKVEPVAPEPPVKKIARILKDEVVRVNEVKEKKPQTGFGSYLERMKPGLAKAYPHLQEKDVVKRAKEMWNELDNTSKNHYIRNSEAYKIKKLALSGSTDNKKRIPKKTKLKEHPHVPAPDSSQHEHHSEAVPSKGYNYPKRNVKRRHFDISDHEDEQDDEDWEMPVSEHRSKPVVPATMPPLKFKKKNRPVNDPPKDHLNHNVHHNKKPHDDDELPSVFDEDVKSVPSPISHKVPMHLPSGLLKESTPPPPVPKTDPAPAPLPDRKTSFKPICLHEGCYEEAKVTDDRGKYWCSDKCCILYSKIIFNAWIAARKANMIE